MAATSAQTLASEGNCFSCYGSVSAVQMMRLVILSRTLTTLNPVAATDPQSLITYANCFNCFASASMGDLMELALLDQISKNVTGGGAAGTNLSGSGSPEGVETAPVGTIYFDISSTTNPGMWVKTTGTGDTGWTEVLAVGP